MLANNKKSDMSAEVGPRREGGAGTGAGVGCVCVQHILISSFLLLYMHILVINAYV